ncbi:hypothetical protein HD553DRAFT_332880 [Filobasidium floriforme]|uniref:uncharacterized protein n=1 Tax=Filobasidium floriforme TaxID=5210 RepID=UPI001E8E5870|nr:uncharacterized protein HD553DRAFT_332880 [Filobasidium floriforme]KAH8090293.1 hypothetical protein HD553DRAFT_332880 [Filobasidium floriforme]
MSKRTSSSDASSTFSFVWSKLLAVTTPGDYRRGKGVSPIGTTALCGRAFNSLDWICGFLAEDKRWLQTIVHLYQSIEEAIRDGLTQEERSCPLIPASGRLEKAHSGQSRGYNFKSHKIVSHSVRPARSVSRYPDRPDSRNFIHSRRHGQQYWSLALAVSLASLSCDESRNAAGYRISHMILPTLLDNIQTDEPAAKRASARGKQEHNESIDVPLPCPDNALSGSPDGGRHAELPGNGSINEEVSALNIADACCFEDIERPWSTQVSGC